MQKTTNFNDNTFFLLKQYKIFHLVEYQISNDNPVENSAANFGGDEF